MPHYRAPNGSRYLLLQFEMPPHPDWVLMTDEEVADADAPKALPPPQEISDRQFFQQLAIMGLITEAEALDAVGPGILPASMLALIDQLPADQRFPAKITLTGATTFRRDHPLTPVLGGMYGLDDAALDALWAAGAQL